MKKNFPVHLSLLLGFFFIFTACSKDEDEVRDIDGNLYSTVKIGNQIWMAENLRVTRYYDGTPLANSGTWESAVSEYYCLYGNSEANSDYGFLYSADAVKSGQLAPKGWHIPTEDEWETLTKYLASNGYGNQFEYWAIGKALAADTGWVESTEPYAPGNDQVSNNITGFNFVPSGAKIEDDFRSKGEYGFIWLAPELIHEKYQLYRFSVVILRYNEYYAVPYHRVYKGDCFPIRCIKN